MIEHEWWTEARKNFAQETDLSKFREWKSVRAVPLWHPHEFFQQYSIQVRHLLDLSSWKNEWIDVIKLGEPLRGHTEKTRAESSKTFAGIPTSTWVLKSLHHVLMFEMIREKSILEYDNIIEFGAGIGETARVIIDRGFKGKYYIIDLPEVLKISSYYLENKIIPIDKLIELPDNMSNSLFIATWSLSEVPMSYRDEVAAKIKGYDQLLIYQKDFEGINNTPYFIEQWPYLTDTFYRIQQLHFHDSNAGNVYMIGKGVNDG